MKKAFCVSFVLIAMNSAAQLNYPVTHKEVVTDDYFGTKVADPYRWLEDDNSAATKAWVAEQNKVTNGYLATIPYRSKIKSRLESLWNYPKYGAPFKKGDYYYFYKNDGLQNQSVLYRTPSLAATPEVFIDPNTLSSEGIAALSGLSFTKDGKLCTYSVSKAGSDWSEIFVMNTETKALLPDKINWTKFGGVAWKGNEGFYYSAYDEPDEQSKLSKKNEFQKVFYHKLGTSQKEDVIIYQDKEHPLRYFGVGLTEDERFLILYVTEGTSGSELWYRDLNDAGQQNFSLLVLGFDTESSVIENKGDLLLLNTNYEAPNYRVVAVDPKQPGRQNWKTVIPEQKEALQGVGTAGGSLFASYLKDAASKIVQYDFEGNRIRDVELPGIGTAGGFGADKEDKTFYYTYTSFATPPAIYEYDIATGRSTLYKKTELNLKTDDIVTEQVFFKSKDGAQVPMFLTYKKGLKKDGNNPVLLYGYGGFNIPMTPGFSVSNAFFVEQGGIYVVVNLRGGSEYGEAWHKAGMLLNKQNVFNDFIGAAEHLIAAKYTGKNKIAVRGGSNGGLLVGAVMTQRPDLFKVAIPQVGVLDMLRFQKFTVGWGWTVEYGSADSAQYFPYLYKYSPYHNLKKGVSYPATLITTGDHDDRVVPAHSFKYAARLQEYHKGSNPVLIRVETNAGHGAGKPTSKVIDEAADIWAFVMYNLGMKFKDQ
ncbi:prolyl oligopeptidase family serine peptidase [Niabella beijingensis]|uniref:prolyl oligopeptidase family serine peptidase n=1 Tax=Niabella beijingensis TaxID=2872700 RepID=UPI001CBF5304|nr:prolyl oligopeptidase family serine peptidase [Niabella beijingensis]MBZ4191001.1 prolyl oligopeptidase family serine peptidase [Niabella beijingensis]